MVVSGSYPKYNQMSFLIFKCNFGRKLQINLANNLTHSGYCCEEIDLPCYYYIWQKLSNWISSEIGRLLHFILSDIPLSIDGWSHHQCGWFPHCLIVSNHVKARYLNMPLGQLQSILQGLILKSVQKFQLKANAAREAEISYKKHVFLTSLLKNYTGH